MRLLLVEKAIHILASLRGRQYILLMKNLCTLVISYTKQPWTYSIVCKNRDHYPFL